MSLIKDPNDVRELQATIEIQNAVRGNLLLKREIYERTEFGFANSSFPEYYRCVIARPFVNDIFQHIILTNFLETVFPALNEPEQANGFVGHPARVFINDSRS